MKYNKMSGISNMKWLFFMMLILVACCFSVVRSQYEPYGENVAFGKPASQSTTYSENGFMYNASLGVDGIKSTTFSSKTCSHTSPEMNNAWWTVDLKGFYLIKFIRIYQMIEVNRLHGSEMYARLKDHTWERIYFNSTLPSVVFNVSVKLNKAIGAIMLNNSNRRDPLISVCEVEAFEVIECLPYSIGNGSIEVVQYGDSNQTFTYGTKLNVTCHEGYRLSDGGVVGNEIETSLECSAIASWSRNLSCSVIDCGQPLNIPDNSTLLSSTGLAGNTSYNATVTVMCEEGFKYTLPGNETIRCGAEGRWTGILGLCKVTRCAEIVPPQYGVIVVEAGAAGRWSFNTTVAIICNTGFSLSGEALVKCYENGRWTSVLGHCFAGLLEMDADQEQSKTCYLSWIILGPLCFMLLITTLVTCIRLRRHAWFKRKKRSLCTFCQTFCILRQNVPDDVTIARNVVASGRRLQAKKGISANDFVEEFDMKNVKIKSNGSDNNVMEPYDNLQMDNNTKSNYDKLKFERDSSVNTTMKNEIYQNVGPRD